MKQVSPSRIIGEYQVKNSCQLTYKKKIVSGISYLEIGDELQLFGEKHHLRTKTKLLYHDKVIPCGIRGEWESLVDIGHGYLKSDNSLIYKDKIIKRVFSNQKKTFSITNLIHVDKYIYLQTKNALYYQGEFIEEFTKKKSKFFVKNLGYGYLQTPSRIIYHGEVLLDDIPYKCGHKFFILESDILSPYLFINCNLIKNGNKIHKFRKSEIGKGNSLKIFDKGLYICSKTTILYRNSLVFQAIHHNEIQQPTYLQNGYLLCHTILFYRGKVIYKFQQHPNQWVLKISLISSELNLLEILYIPTPPNLLTNGLIEPISVKQFQGMYFQGFRSVSESPRVNTTIRTILQRGNTPWNTKMYKEYSDEYQKFIINLLCCVNKSREDVISDDVVIYKIIPFVPEIWVYLTFFQYNKRKRLKERNEKEIEKLEYLENNQKVDNKIAEMLFLESRRGDDKEYENKTKKKQKLKMNWVEKKERKKCEKLGIRYIRNNNNKRKKKKTTRKKKRK